MANTFTSTIRQNGSRYYIVQFNILLDGSTPTTGQLINNTAGDCGTNNAIVDIQAYFGGFSGTILGKATTNVQLLAIPANTHFHECFEKDGPIYNTTTSGFTGDYVLNIVGNGSAGQTGTILMKIKKNPQPYST